MDKIEIITAEAESVRPILLDALERQKRILSESLARTRERILVLTAHLQVDLEVLLAGNLPHPEDQDMDLLELEGELEICRHLRKQLESLEQLTICP